jgi:methionyl-tRNA formyltransferase
MKNNQSSIINHQSLVFFGSGSYSIPVIKMLTGHGLSFVLTTETDGPLLKFLIENNIPYATTKVTGDKKIARAELWKKIENVQPTLGVLASFGAIIPQHIIDLFPEGIWNIHPSLLPKFKGPSPIQYTLLSEDTTTGVTIISLDDQVDHGPILAQEEYPLTGAETSQELLDTLFTKGSQLIEELLLKDQIDSNPQDHSQETWSEKITKESGYIDIENPPSHEQLDKMIRAYHPWPGVWTKWNKGEGFEKIVKFLPNNNIQVEGKKPMTHKDFINGYGEEGKVLLEKLEK